MATSPPPRVFERYHDAHYNRPYFFDVQTQQSLWELPPDLTPAQYVLVDKVDSRPKDSKESDSKQQEEKVDSESEEKSEFQKKQERIRKLQQQNLEALYPEFYNDPAYAQSFKADPDAVNKIFSTDDNKLHQIKKEERRANGEEV
jgi:hypothetical protein